MAPKKSTTIEKLTSYGKSLFKLDSWYNSLTGLGTVTSDKMLSHQPTSISILGDQSLEALYHNDGMANTIVGKLPEDAYRQGFKVEGTDKAEDIEKELGYLNGVAALQKAATWGRLYGWGAVLIISDDPGFPLEQIEPSKIKNMRFEVCDRRDLQPVDETIRRDAEFFKISSSKDIEELDTSTWIHSSRLIQFGGEPTSKRVMQSNWGSDLSVLHRCYDALREYNSNSSSAALMMSDASIKVMKITDFVEILASNDLSSFNSRLNVMDQSMYVGKTLPIDMEEEFQFVERSFSGVGDVITESKVKLAACAGMPITVLFGVSPAGLNATGESDTRHWYDSVQSEQTNTYEAPTEYMVLIVAAYLGIEDSDISIEWKSLWSRTSEEEASFRKMVAEVDIMYMNAGVLKTEEVRQARFGGDQFSAENPKLIEGEEEPEPLADPEIEEEEPAEETPEDVEEE